MLKKQGFIAAGILGLCVGTVGAVDLNTDALKKMQQEGHKIVEAEQGKRMFRLSNGNCLAASGSPGQVGASVIVQTCNDQANPQKWSFDDQGRLVAHGGTCVATAANATRPGSNALLQQCSGNALQKWSLDSQNRISGAAGLCLHANPGGNVIAAACSDADNQKWR
jgi:hypothetical protein